MTRYPLYRRLDEFQGRSGHLRKISAPPGFDPWTVQPIASRIGPQRGTQNTDERLILLWKTSQSKRNDNLLPTVHKLDSWQLWDVHRERNETEQNSHSSDTQVNQQAKPDHIKLDPTFQPFQLRAQTSSIATYWPSVDIWLLLKKLCVPSGKVFWNMEGGSGDFRIGMYYTWKPTRLETYHIGRDLITPGPACVWRSKPQRGQKIVGLLSNPHAGIRRLKRPERIA
jgi:hypothetical protein